MMQIRKEPSTMDSKLKDAAYAGDVATLRQLLREDPLLLHRHAATGALPTDGVLHIAAALGHSDFVKELLAVRQELACDPNGKGLSPLHLASSYGHLSVVKEFLQSTSASQLCLLRDKDGLMPVHAAAIKGRVDVLRELIDASAESMGAQTSRGYSILHLAVLSNNFDSVKLVVEELDEDDDFANHKDDKGNTALHLAVAMKQLQTVKLLLGRKGIEVNDVNSRGATALDVLLESTMELHGDLLLGELIRAAGGRRAAEQEHQQPQQEITVHVETDERRDTVNATNSTRSNRRNLLDRAKGDRFNDKPGTLMVVATLIATITFQAGLSPPGGFNQDGTPTANPVNGTTLCKYHTYLLSNSSFLHHQHGAIGEAVLDDCLGVFLVFDMVGLFASLSIILLLLCCVPRRRKLVMRLLVWIMWIAVFSTAMAFTTAFRQIYSHSIVSSALLSCWFIILALFILWLYIRVTLWLLRKVGWCTNKRPISDDRHAGRAGVALVLVRILVLFLLIVLFVIFAVVGVLGLSLMSFSQLVLI